MMEYLKNLNIKKDHILHELNGYSESNLKNHSIISELISEEYAGQTFEKFGNVAEEKIEHIGGENFENYVNSHNQEEIRSELINIVKNAYEEEMNTYIELNTL